MGGANTRAHAQWPHVARQLTLGVFYLLLKKYEGGAVGMVYNHKMSDINRTWTGGTLYYRINVLTQVIKKTLSATLYTFACNNVRANE